MAQVEEQTKSQGKELNKMEISNVRCGVPNTGYKDAQGSQWILQQRKTQAEMKVTLS